MVASIPPVPFVYGALPPEVNTGRLMAGAGAAPMYQAAAAWESLAIALETQAEELSASLASLAGSWQGGASEQAVQATTPMVVWLHTAALQAQKRAMQAIAQANSYLLAMAVTPPLVEIEANHVTHAVLEATNFLGVNTVPIGVNEFDYFVRMWTQAAVAMHGYQAETAANTMFEPIPPLKPIVMPGVGEAALGFASGKIAATLPGSAMRELAFAQVTAQASIESAALHAGRAAANSNAAMVSAQTQARKGENTAQQAQGEPEQLMQGAQQGAQMGMQVASQVGSMLTQAPQQMMQTVTQPMQQILAPMQQVSSMFGQLGGGLNKGAQFGLMGASPFSNHPLAGGTGAGAGAGLVRAASLPGAGGTLASTPLMSGLLGQTAGAAAPVGAAAGGAGSGLAPVGNGAGGGPMGGMGQGAKRGTNRQSLAAPSALAHDLGEDEDEDDDW
ncbi:MAG: PPE family protein [Mycolicibacterium neoaurum]|uniref:PPE family protein n=1 Tax=Mycolicibacterium neoaurum TaxID=1795 RepID=UPI00056153B7|nr:PPE family protein [Mycolicibacterium neoaurum]QVI28395.1 PPE family protein [Mycolicibacterium neoaurum]SDE67042.1 PPE-repeat protein [Mycolicibacterium neoaurum]